MTSPLYVVGRRTDELLGIIHTFSLHEEQAKTFCEEMNKIKPDDIRRVFKINVEEME